MDWGGAGGPQCKCVCVCPPRLELDCPILLLPATAPPPPRLELNYPDVMHSVEKLEAQAQRELRDVVQILTEADTDTARALAAGAQAGSSAGRSSGSSAGREGLTARRVRVIGEAQRLLQVRSELVCALN